MNRRSFIGGLLATAAAFSLGLSSTAAPLNDCIFYFSAATVNLPSGATVAEVVVFDRVLTADEIAAVYNHMSKRLGITEV